MATVERILIVGGGIGGLTLAAVPHRQGFAAELVERSPRAEWVQEQSRVAARAWLLPPAVRDAALRDKGDRMLRARYRPLVALP